MSDPRPPDPALMRRLADTLSEGLMTGVDSDWPNSQDELTRLQSAELLRDAADELEASREVKPLRDANLSAALRAIVRECRGPGGVSPVSPPHVSARPYSSDSYLPPHLLDLAVAALESAETPLQVIAAMRRDDGVDDEFVANLSPRRLRILARDGDEELS